MRLDEVRNVIRGDVVQVWSSCAGVHDGSGRFSASDATYRHGHPAVRPASDRSLGRRREGSQFGLSGIPYILTFMLG